MIILDTDTCIHLLRGNRNIIEKRQKYPDQVAISFMTVAELFYEAEKSGNPDKNRTVVEQFLLTIKIINSNRKISYRFGNLKAILEKEGLPLADADLLIAATALETSRLLVTGNLKHFQRIKNLALENWIG